MTFDELLEFIKTNEFNVMDVYRKDAPKLYHEKFHIFLDDVNYNNGNNRIPHECVFSKQISKEKGTLYTRLCSGAIIKYSFYKE